MGDEGVCAPDSSSPTAPLLQHRMTKAPGFIRLLGHTMPWGLWCDIRGVTLSRGLHSTGKVYSLATSEQLFEMTSLCMNWGIESLSPLVYCFVYHVLLKASQPCSSTSAVSLPLALGTLVPAPLSKCGSRLDYDPGLATCQHAMNSGVSRWSSSTVWRARRTDCVNFIADASDGWQFISIVGTVDLCTGFHKNIFTEARKRSCYSLGEHLEAWGCCKLLHRHEDFTR